MTDGASGWPDETSEFYVDDDTGVHPTRPAAQSSHQGRPGRGGLDEQLGDGRGQADGVVAGKVERTEQQRVRYPDGHYGETPITVCSFRLDVFDARGNRVKTVPVEMRGAAFTGALAEGDAIAAVGDFVGGILYCASVVHLDTGATYKVIDPDGAPGAPPKGSPRPLVKLMKALFFTFVVGFLVLVFAVVLGGIFGIKLPWNLGDPGSGSGGHVSRQVRMPDVVGEDNVNAAKLLDEAGVNSYLFEDQKAPSKQFNKVLHTDPAAGAVVKPGATVRVYIGSFR